MVWVKLDDHFHSHPKVAALEPRLMLEAIGLNTLAWSWCGENLTDGIVPKGQPARLAGRPVDNLTAELVRVGLWERIPAGYNIHDYLDYNFSKAQVEANRRARSEAGRIGGRQSVQSRRQTFGTAQPQRLSDILDSMSPEAPLEAPLEADAEASASTVPEARLEASPEAHAQAPAEANLEAPPNPEPVSPSSTKNIEPPDPVDNFRDVDFGEDES